jgi:hypothetical protein
MSGVLLPVLLGAWLPLLTPLVIWSWKYKAPLIALSAAAAILVSNGAERFHDMRAYQSPHWSAAQLPNNKARNEATARQAYLSEAIAAWTAANGCQEDTAKCPRLFLVAAQGGASRAAFVVATVLGAIIDVTRKHPKDYVDIRHSLFAFSGVSGGAVGLTLTRTALAESGESGDPPCKRGDHDWFGNGNSARDPTQSWRACLQALAAGDFLSPTVAGLFLRDNLAIPVSPAGDALFSDRAVLLEQALERRYNGMCTTRRRLVVAPTTSAVYAVHWAIERRQLAQGSTVPPA